MRKHKISVLLVITIVFFAFTIGFFMGRNQNHDGITISVSDSFMTAPTSETISETLPTGEKIEVIFPISINHADKDTLMALPGIGEVLAQRILNYRDENGAFSSPEELLLVEGVGKKRLEEILDLIVIGG